MKMVIISYMLKKKEIREEPKHKETLVKLLYKRIPQTLESDPAPAYTPELSKLADEIISLFK